MHYFFNFKKSLAFTNIKKSLAVCFLPSLQKAEFFLFTMQKSQAVGFKMSLNLVHARLIVTLKRSKKTAHKIDLVIDNSNISPDRTVFTTLRLGVFHRFLV